LYPVVTQIQLAQKNRKEIDNNSPVEDEALLNMDVIVVDDDGGEGMGL
jgi:hypothetical protein